MEEQIEEAIEKLKEFNQEQILELLELLNKDERKIISKQILELDFDKINSLYKELKNKEKINSNNTEAITAVNKDKLETSELEKYNELGKNIICNNQYAVVTMSGGQGTRLGYDGPKGTFKIDIRPESKYLFEILADRLKEANKNIM